MNSVLMRSGNFSWFSKRGPMSSSGRSSTSSQKMTAWGFPHRDAGDEKDLPVHKHRLADKVVIVGFDGDIPGAQGRPAHIDPHGRHLSILQRELKRLDAASGVDLQGFAVGKPAVIDVFSDAAVALPHIFPSEPSALNMRISKSARSEGQMRMRPSEPTPKWRSLTMRATSSGCLSLCSRQLT